MAAVQGMQCCTLPDAATSGGDNPTRRLPSLGDAWSGNRLALGRMRGIEHEQQGDGD